MGTAFADLMLKLDLCLVMASQNLLYFRLTYL